MKHPLPHLILEHCTIKGAGLIDLTNNPASSPLRVEVKNCAVKAEALLACRQGTPPSSQIRWQGEANQYDIFGHFWIVLSASEKTPSFLSTATDLQTWSRFAPEDRNPIGDKLNFLTNSAARTNSVPPRNFAIQAPVAPRIRPGADPELVGPWSSR